MGTSTGGQDGTSGSSGTGSSSGDIPDPPPPPPSECGNYIVEPGEQCDQGGVWTATCNENCTLSKCGDKLVNPKAGERCDDGNDQGGDGCAADCSRWDWYGLAQDVPSSTLVGWTPCWGGDYAGGLPWSAMSQQCWPSEQVLWACGLDPGNGQDIVFELVGHGPWVDAYTPVQYALGERIYSNGVAWGWGPLAPKNEFGWIGAAITGDKNHCMDDGEDAQMCIQTWKDLTYAGGRCGEHVGIKDKSWKFFAFKLQ